MKIIICDKCKLEETSDESGEVNDKIVGIRLRDGTAIHLCPICLGEFNEVEHQAQIVKYDTIDQWVKEKIKPKK